MTVSATGQLQAEETIKPIKLMLVDDEPQMLSALQRLFRGEHYAVETFTNPLEALKSLESERFDVIVSDMRMPTMSGADFLLSASQLWPNTPRILLTGYSDQESTVRAINDAKIHQYIAKPWDNQELKKVVDEAAELAQSTQKKEHRAKVLERTNLELKKQRKSLNESLQRNTAELEQAVAFVDLAQAQLQHSYETFIKSFANIINLKIGSQADVSLRIQEHCVMVAEALECQEQEIESIKNAALLYQLGKIFLPENLLNRALCDLSENELQSFRNHAVLAEQALMPIEALEYTAKIIRHQNEQVDGNGFPDGLKGPGIPLGSRILKVVIEFNQHLGGITTGKQETITSTIKYMRNFESSKFDAAVLAEYLSLLDGKRAKVALDNEQFIKTAYLKSNMVVARDLHNHDGILLLSKNTSLTKDLINKLKHYEQRNQMELLVPVKTDKVLINEG